MAPEPSPYQNKKEEPKCYVCDHMKPEFQGKGHRFRMRYALEEVNFEGTPYEVTWPTVVAPSKFCGECGEPLPERSTLREPSMRLPARIMRGW